MAEIFELRFFHLHHLSNCDKVIGSLNKNKMKQKKIHKIINWIKDAWLKAIVVFLIVAGGFYAYAAITWPPDEPNPTTGVVGMFVGTTANTFSAAQSYDAVNNWCATGTVNILKNDNSVGTITNLGAHVCTPDEMINSYNHGSANAAINLFFSKYAAAGQFAWINNGPPGYAFNANDCLGWSDIANSSSGTAWDLKYKFGFLRDCGETPKPFACCK